MVVFSDVNRRKRTAIGGIGARGRKARYSCSKIEIRSTVTKFEISTCGTGGQERGSRSKGQIYEIKSISAVPGYEARRLLWLGLGAFLAAFVFVSLEVGGLLGEESLGLVRNVLTGFNRFFAGEIECVFAC